MRMGGYSPAEEHEATIIVVDRDRWGTLEDAAAAPEVGDAATLALYGRAGLTLVEEIGRVPRWRDRRYARRRLLWGALVLLVTVGPLVLTVWRR